MQDTCAEPQGLQILYITRYLMLEEFRLSRFAVNSNYITTTKFWDSMPISHVMPCPVYKCSKNVIPSPHFSPGGVEIRCVLFGFMSKLASHLERSPLIHSDGYESAGDYPTCFASLHLKSKSFMQYPG
jgi:hypothetical protein